MSLIYSALRKIQTGEAGQGSGPVRIEEPASEIPAPPPPSPAKRPNLVYAIALLIAVPALWFAVSQLTGGNTESSAKVLKNDSSTEAVFRPTVIVAKAVPAPAKVTPKPVPEMAKTIVVESKSITEAVQAETAKAEAAVTDAVSMVTSFEKQVAVEKQAALEKQLADEKRASLEKQRALEKQLDAEKRLAHEQRIAIEKELAAAKQARAVKKSVKAESKPKPAVKPIPTTVSKHVVKPEPVLVAAKTVRQEPMVIKRTVTPVIKTAAVSVPVEAAPENTSKRISAAKPVRIMSKPEFPAATNRQQRNTGTKLARIPADRKNRMESNLRKFLPVDKTPDRKKARRNSATRQTLILEITAALRKAVGSGDESAVLTELTRLERIAGAESNYVLKMKAFWYLRQGDNEKVEELLSKILQRNPDDLNAGLNMAVVEMRTNRHKDAASRLEDLTIKYPDNNQVKEMLKKVE